MPARNSLAVDREGLAGSGARGWVSAPRPIESPMAQSGEWRQPRRWRGRWKSPGSGVRDGVPTGSGERSAFGWACHDLWLHGGNLAEFFAGRTRTGRGGGSAVGSVAPSKCLPAFDARVIPNSGTWRVPLSSRPAVALADLDVAPSTISTAGNGLWRLDLLEHRASSRWQARKRGLARPAGGEAMGPTSFRRLPGCEGKRRSSAPVFLNTKRVTRAR